MYSRCRCRVEFVIVVLAALSYFILASLLALVLLRTYPPIDQTHSPFLTVYKLEILGVLGWFLRPGIDSSGFP
jgi:hypothetical protein